MYINKLIKQPETFLKGVGEECERKSFKIIVMTIISRRVGGKIKAKLIRKQKKKRKISICNFIPIERKHYNKWIEGGM